MRSTLMWSATLCFLVGCGGDGGGPDPEENVHSSGVTSDQTWGNDGTPHIVRGTVRVQGAKLTIAAGATLEFEAGAMLLVSVNGRLEALGTAASPITMRGSQQGRGRWIGLRFRASTANVLRYATLNGCGADDPHSLDSIPAGCVVLGNQFKPDEAPTITIDHVTVDQALGGGLGVYGESRLEGTSTALTVRNAGYVARIPAREAARFPVGGGFASNDTNEVRLAGGTIADHTTLSLDVSWKTEGDILVEGPSAPVLVIPAGTTMRLGGALSAGRSAPGSIQIGSDGGSSVSMLPTGDRWGGIAFGPSAVGGGIRNAVLESCGNVTVAICLSIEGPISGGPAPAPVLKNVTIHRAMGVGLGLTNGGRPGPGSTNLTISETIQRPGTFGGEQGWPIVIHQSPVTSIPDGHYTGNFHDYIWINQLDVRQSQTWVKRDVPYYIFNWISVGDGSSPVLTLEPGVNVVAAGGVWLYVGTTEPGAIRAVGTAASPVVFRGLTDAPGDWGGISIGPAATSSTLFDHAIVENGGGAYPLFGNFLFYVDLGPVIRNTIVRGSAGCGVIITGSPPWATNFTAPALGNTFANNTGGNICGP